MEARSILLADDDPDLLGVLKDALEKAGFRVLPASDGLEALEVAENSHPELIVLDMVMPRLDGVAACRRLKADPRLGQVPVIILSATATRENRIEGLDLGADDFILKPVDLSEFLARVRMVLRRTEEGLDANPLTRLPGNAAIEKRIKQAIASRESFAILYVDLNQFKAYNDAYGFKAGDEAIRATAKALVDSIYDGRNPRAFVGHIGGDDFIALTTPELMEDAAKALIARFDALAPGFYNEEDRRRGRIVSTDRQGKIQEFPLLSVAVGICHNRERSFESYGSIAQTGTELKKKAKRLQGSAYVIDRRKG